MRNILLGAFLGSAAAAAPASAQDVSGQWNCQLANQSVSNNAFENYMYTFGMALYGNGSFEARGQYYAQTNGFNLPFYARGNWQVQQGSVVVQGQEQRQGYNGPFLMMLTVYGPQSMSYRTSTANGNLAMACSR